MNVHPMTTRREEWHVTVSGIDAPEWHALCRDLDVKPLHIELSNLDLQLMLATSRNPTSFINAFPSRVHVTRIKHEIEVPPCFAGVHPSLGGPIYYECHVKFDGMRFPAHAPYLMSRDLYRENRFYATKRQRTPFDPSAFVRETMGRFHYAIYAGHEYEACLTDTNPNLDADWIKALERHPYPAR